jgi:uncharacterized protein (DUF305 family)
MESKAAIHGRTSFPLLGRLASLLTILSVALTATADGPASKRSEARFEIRFMTEMTDHHAMAIEMGMLCVERAVHPELKQLCEEMIAAQSAEIEQMQTWLQDWYGVQHEPEMNPGNERQLEMLASLSGAEFEIEFMRMMIRHHAIAVFRSADCLKRAEHEELVAMCHDMIEAQLDEIHTMQTWLCQWYDICNRGHRHERGNH